jgi:threonine dehydratase
VKGLAVGEEEVAAAVRWAWNEHQLVVEPGGAASIAALLAGKAEIVPETVALVSGGNIDPALHARLVG